MPVWDDFKSLPYINCIMKEGLRWRPLYDKCPLYFLFSEKLTFVIDYPWVYRIASPKMTGMRECLSPRTQPWLFLPMPSIVATSSTMTQMNSSHSDTLTVQDWPMTMLVALILTTEISSPRHFASQNKLTYLSLNITMDMGRADESAQVYILQNALSGELSPSCCGPLT